MVGYMNACGTPACMHMNPLDEIKPFWETSRQLGFKKLQIRCEYCREYLCEASETQCGHAFCSECIGFYLLYLDACPACEAPLRRTTLFRNIALDNIIEGYIQLKAPSSLAAFRERKQAWRQARRARRVGRVRVGVQVDVRDEDYVWCVGTVRRVVQGRSSNTRCLLVQLASSRRCLFLGADDERVAVLGSYTNRAEVPHYSHGRVVFEQQAGVETELETSCSEGDRR